MPDLECLNQSYFIQKTDKSKSNLKNHSVLPNAHLPQNAEFLIINFDRFEKKN